MPELLLELLSEDIPARMQKQAAEDLKRLVCEGLDEKRLGKYFSEARSFVTPRRLALVIDNLPERQMVGVEVRKGPRSDAPEQAIKGFKGNLPKGAKVKVRETTKGTFLFASIPKSAQSAPEVLPEIAQPRPGEDAEVEELQEAERADEVEEGKEPEEATESVQTQRPPEPEEGVLRIPLQQLIPELSSGPDAGSKILPEGFDFEAQQKYLEELLEAVGEGRDLADILEKEPDLVERALGSRAKVYPLGGLPHGAYEALESYNLERIQRPQECLTQCTWGFALGEQYGQPKDGVLPTRRLCLNKNCFRSKASSLTASRNKRGKTGIEKEREVVEQAARGMVEKGTVNLGRGECLLLLHTLTEGSSYQGATQVYWWDPLLPHLGIQGKSVKTEVREEGWKALQERPVEELRYFVGLMMLERVRSHAKPTDWKPSLNPWLKLLDTPHLEGGSEVEMAEPAKR